MTNILPKVWTYEDYLNLPDDGNRYEVIKGKLLLIPLRDTAHQYCSGKVLLALHRFVITDDLGEVYHAPYDVRLSKDADPVEPDILFIAKDHLPHAQDIHFAGVPDLVVEILSKSTVRTDSLVKFSIYEDAGVAEYWIVDPKTRTVRIYTLENGKYAEWGAYTQDEVITSKVLAGLEIVNNTLFKS